MANNADKTKLIPTYVEGDFNTSLNKFKDLLIRDETFKDFNYHGSNIAMIIELLSYMSDFTNFYTNLVAKNVYLDTADVYETVHRLVYQKGYIPLGYVSSEATVYLTVEDNTSATGIRKNDSITDTIVVDEWQTINTGLTDANGNAIYYTLTDRVAQEATENGKVEFELKFRQGTIDELLYSGFNIVDNQIVLPFRPYDVGMYPFDTPAIQVTVNGEEWLRVHDFYDHISGLEPQERNIYSFYYDKYERYILSFVSSANVPNDSDTIRVRVLRSLGIDGLVGANAFSLNSDNLDELSVRNITHIIPVGDGSNTYEPVKYIQENFTRFDNPEASVGGSNPETITQLKANANANMHTQFRNVTRKDYKFHMEMRSDVVKGAAWGEQEVDPGNTIEYNKVYVSALPRYGTETLFLPGVLETTEIVWRDTDVEGLSATIEVPTTYTTAFENDLLRYLEPRKMISVYEFPVVPQSVYFRFDIGIRVNRAFKFTDVVTTVKDKLIYFFNSINREYNEEINFMDIHNFIFDMSVADGDEYFLNIRGLDNLVIRDISTYTICQAPSGSTCISAGPSGDVMVDFSPFCSLSDYLSGAAYDEYIQDSKLAMGTLTEPVSAWTGFYDVFEPNDVSNYPQYTQEAKAGYYENKLRPIQLGYNQFPMLSIEMCRFFNESL